jgi:hypothetical protein
MLRYWYIFLSCLFFAEKARVRYHTNPDILYKVVFNGYFFTPRRIYAERNGIGTGFTPNTSVSTVSRPYMWSTCISFIYRRCYTRILPLAAADVVSRLKRILSSFNSTV